MRRVAAVLAIVVGIVLIGFTFAEHLFARSQDAQTIADQYAPLMSAKGLHDLSTGFDLVKVAGTELSTKAEPRLQQVLGMDDAQFERYVAQQMPGIVKFDAQAPGVVELVGPVIGKMEAVRGDYTKASEIPVSWLPLTSAPWLFLGIGVLLIGIGAYTLWRPGTLASIALVLVGLGIAIAPLVIGIPGKVDAAVSVTEIGRIGLAPATGQKAVGATALFDGMASDVHTKLEPALDSAARRGLVRAGVPDARQVDRQLAALDVGKVPRAERQPGRVRVDVRQRRQDPVGADPVDVHRPGHRARGPCRRDADPVTTRPRRNRPGDRPSAADLFVVASGASVAWGNLCLTGGAIERTLVRGGGCRHDSEGDRR